MADFGWAYINCDTGSGGGTGARGASTVAGPLKSVQFLTGTLGSTGSANFTFETGSGTLFVTGTVAIKGTISASHYHVENVTTIDGTGSTKFGNTNDDTHVRTGSLSVWSTTAIGGMPATPSSQWYVLSASITDNKVYANLLDISGSTEFGSHSTHNHLFTGSVKTVGSITATGTTSGSTVKGNSLNIGGAEVISSAKDVHNVANISATGSILASTTITANTIVSGATAKANELYVGGSQIISPAKDLHNVTNINATGSILASTIISGATAQANLLKVGGSEVISAAKDIHNVANINATGSILASTTVRATTTVSGATAQANALNVGGSEVISSDRDVHNVANINASGSILASTIVRATTILSGATVKGNLLSVGGAEVISPAKDIHGVTNINATGSILASTTVTATTIVSGATAQANLLKVGGSEVISAAKDLYNITNINATGTLGVSGSSKLGSHSTHNHILTGSFYPAAVSGALAGNGSYLGLSAAGKLVVTGALGFGTNFIWNKALDYPIVNGPAVQVGGTNSPGGAGETFNRPLITISAWVRHTSSTGTQQGFLFNLGGTGRPSNLALRSNDALRWTARWDDTVSGAGATNVYWETEEDLGIYKADAWTHVAMVFDLSSSSPTNANAAGDPTFYVNGILKPTVLRSTAYASVTGATAIQSGDKVFVGNAGSSQGNLKWRGQIADFSYWQLSMSQEQITEIYASGSHLNLLKHSAYISSSDNLYAWYRLGNGLGTGSATDAVDGTGTYSLSNIMIDQTNRAHGIPENDAGGITTTGSFGVKLTGAVEGLNTMLLYDGTSLLSSAVDNRIFGYGGATLIDGASATGAENRIAIWDDYNSIKGTDDFTFTPSGSVGLIGGLLDLTGSSRFGTIPTHNHIFTGSMYIDVLNVSSGSLAGTGSYLGLNTDGNVVLTSSGGTAAAITSYTNSGNDRIITSVDSSTVNGEANLTFDGSTLTATNTVVATSTISGATAQANILKVGGLEVISSAKEVHNVGNINATGSILASTTVRATTIVSGATAQANILKVGGSEVISPAREIHNVGNISATGSILASTTVRATTTLSGATGQVNSLSVGGLEVISSAKEIHNVGNISATGSILASTIVRATTIVSGATAKANLLNIGGTEIITPAKDIHNVTNLNVTGGIYMGATSGSLAGTGSYLGLNTSGRIVLTSSTGTSAAITSYTNPADNRVITSVDSSTVNSEANLTFDGTTLSATNTVVATSTISGATAQANVLKVGGSEVISSEKNVHNVGNINATGSILASTTVRATTTVSGATSQVNSLSVGGSEIVSSARDLHNVANISATGSILASTTVRATTIMSGATGQVNSLKVGGSEIVSSAKDLYNVANINATGSILASTTVRATTTMSGATAQANSLSIGGSELITPAKDIHNVTNLNVTGGVYIGASSGSLAGTGSYVGLNTSGKLVLTSSAAGAITSYQNAGNNRILTSVDGSTVKAEGNLTFDGTKFTVTGGIIVKRATKDDDYTITDSDYIIGVDSSNAAVVLTFPAASSLTAGQMFIVKDENGSAGTNNITVTGSDGSNTIDGQTSAVLESSYASITIYCDGSTKFFIV